jgi:CheY-like chemotaxis protein
MSCSPQKRPCALVVDDDSSVSLALNFLLGSIGWDAVQADHANQALEEMSKRHFDLILIDIKMPEIDGIELCRLIRGRTDRPAPTIIVLSGYIAASTQAAALAAGATAVREKPIGRDELIDLFRQNNLPCKPQEAVSSCS